MSRIVRFWAVYRPPVRPTFWPLHWMTADDRQDNSSPDDDGNKLTHETRSGGHGGGSGRGAWKGREETINL